MAFSRLTLLEGVASDPVISPDGKWVAYSSPVSGNPEIYLQSKRDVTVSKCLHDRCRFARTRVNA